jgi:hypothetical protein
MNRKTKKDFLFGFIIFHFCVITAVAFIGNYSSTKEYLSGDSLVFGDGKQKDIIQKAFSSFLILPGIKQYATFSGTNASYDYFAPRIANSVVIESLQKDQNENVVSTTYLPPILKTFEGIQRYKVFFTIIQQGASQLNGNEKKDFFKTALRSLAERNLKRESDPRVVSSSINFYIYKFPSLAGFTKGEKPTLVSLINVDVKK